MASPSSAQVVQSTAEQEKQAQKKAKKRAFIKRGLSKGFRKRAAEGS